MARTADDQSRLNFDNLNGSNLLEIQRSLDKCGNLFKVNSISAISSGEHGLRDFVVFLTSVSFDRKRFHRAIARAEAQERKPICAPPLTTFL